MRVYIDRYYGEIKGAYWAPKTAGFDFAERAEAALSTDGTVRVFQWENITRFDRYSRRTEVIGRQHCGSTAHDIERGKRIDPEILAQLRTALDAAIANDAVTAERAEAIENGERDLYGNLIGETE